MYFFVGALRVSIDTILFSVCIWTPDLCRLSYFDDVSPGHILMLTKNSKDSDSFARYTQTSFQSVR